MTEESKLTLDELKRQAAAKQKEITNTEAKLSQMPAAVKDAAEAGLKQLRQELSDINAQLSTEEEAETTKLKADLKTLISGDMPKESYLILFLSQSGNYMKITNRSKNPDRLDMIKTGKLNVKNVRSIMNRQAIKRGMTTSGSYFRNLKDADIEEVFLDNQRQYENIFTAFLENPEDMDEDFFDMMELQKKFWTPLNREVSWDTSYEFTLGEPQECSMFDEDWMLLNYSLGGGKQDNINYLEQFVVYKYLYPHRVADMPLLEIVGQPGRNGKGLLQRFIQTVFTVMGAKKINDKALSENGFNAMLEGLVVCFLDDPNRKNVDPEVIKQVVANLWYTIEPKGVDAYQVAATALILICANYPTVKLVGSGEDRRYSIIHTNKQIHKVFMEHYGCSEEEAQARIRKFADNVLDNRTQVSKYISHMAAKWNMLPENNPDYILPPHHGDDYKARLDNQKDSIETLFENVWPVILEQGCMPYSLWIQLIKATTGIEYHKQQSEPVNKFTELANRKLSAMSVDEVTSAGITVSEIVKTRKTCRVHKDNVKGTETKEVMEGWFLNGGSAEFNTSRVSTAVFSKHGEIMRSELDIAQYDANGVYIDSSAESDAPAKNNRVLNKSWND